jgi:uncharacterized protein (TIGR00266 family)
MYFEIKGDNLPVLLLNLNRGESVYTDNGAMAWRTAGIEMDTGTRGGLLKGIGRAFSGENIFLNTFTSNQDNQELAIASAMPGSIKDFTLNGTESIICQKKAFLAADTTVELDIAFTKRFSAGLLGGEGFILQRLSGSGKAFLEIDGSLIERTLAPGEELIVDQGHIAFFDESVKYEIITIKGMKNIFLGGEGLFMVKLVGPGHVGLQSMPIVNLAKQIIPYVPQKSN